MQSCRQTPTLKKELAASILRVIQCWVNEGKSYIGYNEGNRMGSQNMAWTNTDSYFWLVSFLATCLHHHSASSLYSLWPWRWI